MERGREGRRGNGGGGAVSATRRPRTSGFKDTPDGDDVMDDLPNARLRERSKKDSSSNNVITSQAMPVGSLGCTSRNKRKRQGSQELQGPVRSCAVDEHDETTEDTEMGGSEDDDDPPPPPIPRRLGKSRPQVKVADDGVPADLPTVPRKARTAILKRPQESPSLSVADSSHQVCVGVSKVSAAQGAPASSSVVSLKPGRRMKSSFSKLGAMKIPKVSITSAVTEKEAEVAEALFDLARMVTSQSASSKQEVSVDKISELKAESGSEPEVQLETKKAAINIVTCPLQPPFLSPTPAISTSRSSPQTSPVVLTASVSVSPRGLTAQGHDPAMAILPFSVLPAPPAEAPKRKRPRVKARLELVGRASEVPVLASSSAVSNASRLTVPKRGVETEENLVTTLQLVNKSPVKGESVIPLTAVPPATPASAAPPSSLPSAPDSIDFASPAIEDSNECFEKKPITTGMDVKVEISSASSPSSLKKCSPQLDEELAPTGSPPRPAILTSETDQASSKLSDKEPLLSVDLCKRLTQRSSASVGGRPRDDFDLAMGLPNSVGSQPPRINSEEGQDGEGDEEHDVTHERNNEDEDEGSEGIDTDRDMGRGSDMSREGLSQSEPSTGKGSEGEELATHQPQRTHGKLLELSYRDVSTERNASTTVAAVSSFLASASHVASPVTAPSCPMTSIGPRSWPAGIPPLGSAAAGAMWPCTSVGGAASVDENLPSGAQQPFVIQARHHHRWKRCASHVYIAHFIDVQQQLNGHPLIQAAYQNSASLYGTKSYNLNIPLPAGDALFGNGSGVPFIGTVSGSHGGNAASGSGSSSGLGILAESERIMGVTSVVGSTQPKDRLYGDTLRRNQSLQQQQHPSQSSPNLSLQSGPGVGSTVTQAGTTAAGGPNIGATTSAARRGSGEIAASACVSSSLVVNSTSTIGSPTVPVPGAGSSGVASHTVAQAQYLQAMMQQGGFSFPFQATAHFGPSFRGPPGHIGPQQAAQFFGNPFYTTHVMHPPGHAQQQVQTASKGTGVSSVQQHQHQHQHQLHTSQQGVRNVQPCSPQQQLQSTLAPISQPPSHPQQQHTHSGASQKILQLVERDGSNLGDDSSSPEGKHSNMQRIVLGQGSPGVTEPIVSPSSSAALGSVQTPQDFNLLATLGTKQSRQQQQQQGQMTSQQQSPTPQHLQVAPQLHGSSSALHMSLKGMDEQSSQACSHTAIIGVNRSSVAGPGPLGLASAASVMAPQGHALLPSGADPSRGHAQYQQPHQQCASGQLHQHALKSSQQQLQHRGATQVQITTSAMVGLEDNRPILDGTSVSSKAGKEAAEEKKLSAKRGATSNPSLARVEVDNTVTMQSISSGGLPLPRITCSGVPTLNLMTPAPTILVSRPSGYNSGGGHQASSTVPPGTQSSKQTLSRSKLLAGIGSNTTGPSSQSQISFSDRPPLGTSLPSKGQVPPLSLSGLNIPQSTQGSRQGQASQHSQLKLSNRGSSGASTTPAGTTPQAVLAAAIVKNHQGSQQQSRVPAQLGVSAESRPRLQSGNSGGILVSTSIPLPPLPPTSKSAPTTTGKSNFSSKGTFPPPPKATGASGKRATPLSSSHVSSLSGTSALVQNVPAKSFQSQIPSPLPSSQSQQSMSQYHTHSSKAPQQSPQHSPSVSQVSMQYHQQQAHLSSQQLQVHSKHPLMQQQQAHQMQRHVYLQNPQFQQLPQSTGSLLSHHSHEQSLQQGHQQNMSPSSQSQQQSGAQMQQEQPSFLHQNSQISHGTFPAPAANGSLSLGSPTLTLGTGTSGSNSSARLSSSDNTGPSQSIGLKSNSSANKTTASPGAVLANPRSHSTTPSFLQSQFGSNISPGQHQPSSPPKSSGTRCSHTVISSEASDQVAEPNVMSDGSSQEQVKVIHGLPPVHHPGESGPQPKPNRQGTGKGSIGKSVGGQFDGNQFIED